MLITVTAYLELCKCNWRPSSGEHFDPYKVSTAKGKRIQTCTTLSTIITWHQIVSMRGWINRSFFRLWYCMVGDETFVFRLCILHGKAYFPMEYQTLRTTPTIFLSTRLTSLLISAYYQKIKANLVNIYPSMNVNWLWGNMLNSCLSLNTYWRLVNLLSSCSTTNFHWSLADLSNSGPSASFHDC